MLSQRNLIALLIGNIWFLIEFLIPIIQSNGLTKPVIEYPYGAHVPLRGTRTPMGQRIGAINEFKTNTRTGHKVYVCILLSRIGVWIVFVEEKHSDILVEWGMAQFPNASPRSIQRSNRDCGRDPFPNFSSLLTSIDINKSSYNFV